MAPAPDYLRGLALTCAALALLGLLALVRHDGASTPATPRRNNLAAAAAEVEGRSGGVDVPSTLLPLFPTTTSTRPAKAAKPTAAGSTTRKPGADTALAPPALGAYAYSVEGSEAMTGFGSRKLPETMKLTAHRSATVAADEVVFDLRFSAQHTEREIVGFGSDLISLRHHAMTVVFGPVTRNSDATYRPPVGRAVLPLGNDAARTGTSDALGGAGQSLRTEDWKVTDLAPRVVTIAGHAITAWELVMERSSRPGATEELRETRRAWFDPARRMWVKWENHLHTERASDLSFAYDLNYTATLTGFAPA